MIGRDAPAATELRRAILEEECVRLLLELSREEQDTVFQWLGRRIFERSGPAAATGFALLLASHGRGQP